MEPFKEGSKVPLFFGINTSYIKFELHYNTQSPKSDHNGLISTL